jgi:hypothetical protein
MPLLLCPQMPPFRVWEYNLDPFVLVQQSQSHLAPHRPLLLLLLLPVSSPKPLPLLYQLLPLLRAPPNLQNSKSLNKLLNSRLTELTMPLLFMDNNNNKALLRLPVPT